MSTENTAAAPVSESAPSGNFRSENRLIWSTVETFRDEQSGLCVSIRGANLNQDTNPNKNNWIYSLQFGKETNGKFTPFVPIMIDMSTMQLTSTQVEPRFEVTAIIKNLVKQAEDWVLHQKQKELHTMQEDAYHRDLEKAKRGQPVTSHTGKTQREREKRVKK